MSLFVCDNCGTRENTALGHFWARAIVTFKKFKNKKLALCSECLPVENDDGSINDGGGKWHGKFPKEIMTTEKIDERGREHFVYTAGL